VAAGRSRKPIPRRPEVPSIAVRGEVLESERDGGGVEDAAPWPALPVAGGSENGKQTRISL
jgi:hypothetical protein